MKKVIPYTMLGYSALTILFYVFSVVYCTTEGYTISYYQTALIPTILIVISVIVKCVSLFFVKKGGVIVVNISIILTALYTGYFVLNSTLLALLCSFIASIIITSVSHYRNDKRRSAVLHFVPSLVVLVMAFGFLALMNIGVCTHSTVELYESPTGEYAVQELNFWSNKKIIFQEFRIKETETIDLYFVKLTKPGAHLFHLSEGIIYTENEPIKWLDDQTFEINGVRCNAVKYLEK